MTTKTIKTILFASLFVAMILPFSGMQSANGSHLPDDVANGTHMSDDQNGTHGPYETIEPEGTPNVPDVEVVLDRLHMPDVNDARDKADLTDMADLGDLADLTVSPNNTHDQPEGSDANSATHMPGTGDKSNLYDETAQEASITPWPNGPTGSNIP